MYKKNLVTINIIHINMDTVYINIVLVRVEY